VSDSVAAAWRYRHPSFQREQRFVRAESVDADPLAVELEAALRMGKSVTVTQQGEECFLTVQAPAQRLTLIGAVHNLANAGAEKYSSSLLVKS
jgi:hypothetical protein